MAFDATLVVLAAGMGSRFGGLKQIEPIGPSGEALLDFSVHDAKKAGFNKVVFIIKKAIEKDFKETVGKRIEKIIDVDYVFQETDMLPQGFSGPEGREKPWGTGHAVYCCKDAVKTPFAVINADDYYGYGAYKSIYDYLSRQTGNYCMVGFRLKNTLTENGSVSRGVCEIEDGKLKKITERTKIIDCKYTEDDKEWIPLSPETVVSMNMWGFTPDLFNYTEELLKEFLREKINVPKSEFYLPSIASTLMERGEKEVEVLMSEDSWYGVTYREDKDKVINALAEKIRQGEYNF